MSTAYYDKVYPALFNHPAFIPYFNELMHSLQSTNINALIFSVSESSWDPAKRAEAVPILKIANHNSTWELNIIYNDFEPSYNKALFQEIDAEFLRSAWKTISTYNCSFSVAYNGRSNGKHKERNKSFTEWIGENLYPLSKRTPTQEDAHLKTGRLYEYLEEMRITNQRIVSDWNQLRNNKDYSEAANEALIRHACEKIRQVMSRYSWLGDEALRRGVQTFIVGDIMDL